jgi:hypothetical protein
MVPTPTHEGETVSWETSSSYLEGTELHSFPRQTIVYVARRLAKKKDLQIIYLTCCNICSCIFLYIYRFIFECI